jgi:hypothetical protein
MSMRTLVISILVLAAASLAADDTAYIFSRSGHTRIHTGELGLDAALSLKDRFEGDFLWFRQGGRDYVISDPAALRSIAALFAPVEALDPEVRAVHDRLRPLEKRESELEDMADRLNDRDGDLTAEERQRLRELNRKLRELSLQMEKFEAEEERLDDVQERLEAQAERAMMPLLERAARSGIAQRVNGRR